MISNRQAAEFAVSSLNAASAELERSIIEVNRTATAEEAKAYRQRVGEIFYTIIFGLLEPLYETIPI